MKAIERNPPKSAEEIKSKLQSISKTADNENLKGPYNEETNADRQICVASFFDHKLGREFQALLTRHRLFSYAKVQNRKLAISVDFPDSKLASSLSKEFRSQHPDRRSVNDAARYDFMIFGGITAVTISIMFLKASDVWDLITFSIAMTGLGISAGHLLDRLRTSFGQRGRAAFGLWEFLVIVSILAMMIVTIRVFPAVLK